ncbi:MAG: ornithine carbamoyltransferase [Desulfobacterales bacterium]|nr:ornithine carbamoyltransferase [Desulfobacterales bacterium]
MKIPSSTLTGKSLISIHDLSIEEINQVFDLTAALKSATEPTRLLEGKILGMIFEKPSTRTRVSFEAGIYQLGGTGIFLNANDLQLGRGETIADTARVLSRYVDIIMARTFEHSKVTDLAQYGTIPVINGLTDLLHPCQGMADMMTILEHKGRLKNIQMTYIGDGNNVAHSLMFGAAKVGMHLNVTTPPGCEPDEKIVKMAKADAEATGSRINITTDPVKSVKDVDVIYTDVWTSMGQEKDNDAKIKMLQPYQVNTALVKNAKDDCIVMHCLPAHRGEEITDNVVDGPHSVVLDEAENRMHVQKAIMALLLGN